MPKVSIIIPTYNCARFLPEAMDSVLAQTYKDYEIIVVDDGSTDNTKEILAPYFDKIKYIYQNNQGVSSATNTGIRHSQGEYIAFLDADDIWLQEKLQTQVDYLDNNPEIAMVYSRFHRISMYGKPLPYKKKKEKKLPSGDIQNKLFLRSFIGTPTVLVRKNVLDTVGLFDESLMNSEDRDLWFRIAQKFKVAGIDKYLCKCRLTPGSLSRRNDEAKFQFRRQRIEKNSKLSQESGRPIPHALYKKALAKLFFNTGKWYLKQGDSEKALKYFFLSFKHGPFSPKILKILKHCFLLFLRPSQDRR